MGRRVIPIAILVILSIILSVEVTADEVYPNYYLLIFDSSGSMNKFGEDGRRKIDIAREVFIDRLRQIKKTSPESQVALRVLGHIPKECYASELLVPFGPISKNFARITKELQALQPTGWTPIGYSLREAVRDFPPLSLKDVKSKRIIILITDAEEICEEESPEDFCAAAEDIFSSMSPMWAYIVGYDVRDEKVLKDLLCVEKVAHIRYVSAPDIKSLREASVSLGGSFLRLNIYSGGKLADENFIFTHIISKDTGIIRHTNRGNPAVYDRLEAGTYDLEIQCDTKTNQTQVVRNIKVGSGQSIAKDIEISFGELLIEAGDKYKGDIIFLDILNQYGRKVNILKIVKLPISYRLRAGKYKVVVKFPLSERSKLMYIFKISKNRRVKIKL